MTRENIVLDAVRIDALVKRIEKNVGRRLTLKKGPFILVS